MATIVTPNTRPQMATVRPGVMEKQEPTPGAKGELVKVDVQLSESNIQVEVLDVVKEAKELVSLTDAGGAVLRGIGQLDDPAPPVFATLDADELATLRDLLRRLRRH